MVFKRISDVLGMIKFSHTLFALPFALLGAVTAWSMLRRADAEHAAAAAAAAERAPGGPPVRDGTGAAAAKASADDGAGRVACRPGPRRDRPAGGDDCGDRSGLPQAR